MLVVPWRRLAVHTCPRVLTLNRSCWLAEAVPVLGSGYCTAPRMSLLEMALPVVVLTP
jgi:hypothetical protein